MRRVAPARLVAELWTSLASCDSGVSCSSDIEHGRWVELLIDAGVLESALTDLLCPEAEEELPATRALRALTRAAADAVGGSWGGRLADRHAVDAQICALRAALAAVDDALDGASLPDEIAAGVPEGFTYYGLYPETFLQAARDFHDARRPRAVMCVGIRSVGTSLAAVVGAELASLGVHVRACTVRPRGHPFDRRVTIGASLADRLRAHAAGGDWFAVVDEGPGISGSSFAGTVEALEALGAAPERIALFPSWDPDPSSLRSERARASWARAEKYVTRFEDVWVKSGRLAGAAARAGLQGARLEDISAGAWRERLYADRRDWPAVQPQHERRKYLLAGSESVEPVLLKFAGLGRHGRAALERARRLADGGGTTRPLQLVDGFLASVWADGEPVVAGDADDALLDAIAQHLARMRRDFPSSRPVPYDELHEMMRINTAEGCGEDVAGRIAALEAVTDLVRRGLTTEVDGRMLPHEWLRTPDGYRKVDAVDHHDDHFLPAAQDVAWDLAGACLELMLDERRTEALVTRYAAAAGDSWIRLRLPFYRVSYLAYRLGYVTLGAEALGGGDDADGLRAQGRRYRAMLERDLATLAAADAPLLPAPNDDIRLVIFDADQTLRRATMGGRPCPHGPGDWELLPGVREALGRVRWGEGGVAIGVASNQDQVGYGHLSERMARRLLTDMVVEATGHVPPAAAVQLCPHVREAACDCRKPLPGMLQRIVWHYAVASRETLFVGDAETDRDAARRAGVRFASPADFMTSLRDPPTRSANRSARRTRTHASGSQPGERAP